MPSLGSYKLRRCWPTSVLLIAILASGCSKSSTSQQSKATPKVDSRVKHEAAKQVIEYKTATFAAGCFWGVEAEYMHMDGVVSTAVGYTGGTKDNPTYDQVCSGSTGHAEAVEVIYDPTKVSYEKLLDVFWESHDPTTLNRQGPDIGTQYRSAIFLSDADQRAAAMASMAELKKSGRVSREIVTQLMEAKEFYRAEEYHQQYLEKYSSTMKN